MNHPIEMRKLAASFGFSIAQATYMRNRGYLDRLALSVLFFNDLKVDILGYGTQNQPCKIQTLNADYQLIKYLRDI